MNNVAVIKNEIWKNIPGLENLYQASNFGQIKSLKTNRILKISLGSEGYYRCTLITTNKKCPYVIHRLIALTYLDNPNNLPIVHHKNHNKLDNRIENLEWTTRKNNSKFAAENGRYRADYIKKKNLATRLTNNLIPKYYFNDNFLENEFWIDIKDFEEHYQISNYGRVKSKTRKTKGISRGGLTFDRYRKSQLLKPSFSRDSYLHISLYNEGVPKTFSIHQLVARHFLSNPNNYTHINHLDSNATNNHVSNLEWTTAQKNNEYSRIHGNWDELGEKNCAAKLNNSQVLQIRKNADNKSIGQLAREYKVTRKCISNILNRKSWSHI